MRSRYFLIDFLLLLIFVAFLFPSKAFAVECVGEWQLRNPSSISIHMEDMAFGKGSYVASTVEGLVYSNDLTSWKKASKGTMFPVTRIRFLNDIFYASTGEAVLSSPDGIVWQEERIPSNKVINDITFGNGTVVAVGDEGIFVSEKGERWTKIQIGPTSPRLMGIAYGNGVFVATGEGGAILYSQDGFAWFRAETDLTDDIVTVAFGNGRFLVGTSKFQGGVSTGGPQFSQSSNGYTWSKPAKINLPVDEAILWKNDKWWGTTTDSVCSSADGMTWEKAATLKEIGAIKRIVDANEALGVFGNRGLYLSPDGKNWKPITSGTKKRLDDIVYADGVFVAVGSGGVIMSSADGLKWKEQQFKSKGFKDFESFQSVIHAYGKFIIAGGSGTIITSTSGDQWKEQGRVTKALLYKLVKGKEAIVAVGTGGTIIRSTDAENWGAVDSGIKDDIVQAAYGAGCFVALTNNGKMLISADEGKTWAPQVFGENLKVRFIAYGNGLFLLTAQEKEYPWAQHVYASQDGYVWQRQSENPLRAVTSLNHVAGSFVATTSGAALFSSIDGRAWTDSQTGSLGGFNGIAFGKNSFVAVGSKGKIIQAEAK